MPCPSSEALTHWAESLDRNPVALHAIECGACRAAVAQHREARAVASTLPSGGEHPVPSEELVEAEERYASMGVELGRGGLGRVVLANDRVLRRPVAVKELTVADDRDARVRFEREARLAAQLEHPGIISVYDLGRDGDGRPFYVMRRVEGRTLSAAIAEAKTLEARQALLGHVLSVCHAVAYAHSRSVLHRDIKPQNVMVGRFGETMLLDWGLAREDAGPGGLRGPSETGAGTIVGTPAYMSPEQARGDVKAIDERSDVYGLGALLYEVLTGRPPHDGPTIIEVIHQIRSTPVRPLRELEPDAPPELAAVAMKCLAFDPAQRYAKAGDVAADVERFLTGGRISAYHYATLELLRRFARRHRAVLSVAAAALVAVLVVLAVSYRSVQRERDELRGLAAAVLLDIADKVEPVPGLRPLLDTLTARALEVSQRLAASTAATHHDRRLLAQTWKRIGAIEDGAGRYAEAERAFAQALAQATPLLSTGERRSALEVLIVSRTLMGEHSRSRSDLARARALLEETERLVPLAREESARQPGDDMYRALAYAAYARASLLARTLDYAAALTAMDEAIDMDVRALSLRTPTERDRYNLLTDMTEAASYAEGARLFDEAGKRYDAALKLARDNHARAPTSIDAVYGLGVCLKVMGLWERRFGSEEKAGALLDEAAEQTRWLLKNDPKASINVEFALEVASNRGDTESQRALLGRLSRDEMLDAADEVAAALVQLGRYDEAVALWKEIEAPWPTTQVHALVALVVLGRSEEARALARDMAASDTFGDYVWKYGGLKVPAGTPAAALVEALDTHDRTLDRVALRAAFQQLQADLP